jgi:hypothetical protein
VKLPRPEVAHSLIRGGVVSGVGKRHSKRDIRAAATIIQQATASISNEIYFVGPELN